MTRTRRALREIRLAAVSALGALFLLGALDASPVQAQVVTGSVVDSTSRQPIPGAVVQLLGANGEEYGRGLSDARGAFVVRVRGDVRRVRIVRIGFSPRLLDVSIAAAEPAARALGDIAMRRIPAFLDPVRVVAAQCRGRSNRGRSPIALIEQARAGLLTSVVTRDQNPATMRRLTYERLFEGDSRRPTEQIVRSDSSTQQTRSFRAAQDAGSFVESGFVQPLGDEQIFFAPDADVLLDDRFAAGYCFRVMPRDRDRPREIGLGFEPATRRAGRVDVEGALWIDTVARELRELSFRYVGLNRRIEALGPGGSVSFQTLPNGLVIVDRWSMYLIGEVPDTLASSRPGTVRLSARLVEVRNGGELAAARWSDGTEWRAALGTVTGSARWRDGRPASGATLALGDTPFRTVVTDAGQYSFEGLLPGSYTVFVDDSALLSIGLDMPTSQRVTTDRDSTRLELILPTRADVAGRHCPASGPFDPNNRTLFLGRALRTDRAPIEDAIWGVRLNTPEGWVEVAKDGRTGSNGLMPYCTGLRRGAELEVTVRTPEGLVDVQRRRLTEPATIVPFVFPMP